jgi:hypothetical protein
MKERNQLGEGLTCKSDHNIKSELKETIGSGYGPVAGASKHGDELSSSTREVRLLTS